MVITGYPPEDLLLKLDFVESAMRMLHEIVRASEGLTAIVGCVYADDDLYNAAAGAKIFQRNFRMHTQSISIGSLMKSILI